MPFFKMIENVSRHFSKSKKIRVALLIDEFFGGAGTAYGGYGFLARKFIAKYIPDEDIEIDVLLGKREKKGGLPSIFALKEHCDNVDLHWLPRRKFFSSLWLAAKHYDLYLSIELTDDYVLKCEKNDKKKLILWIQDPDDNKKMMREYLPPNNPKNLIFKGHVDGEEKKELLKSARILINTSIWEGIPISWLECLSYGTVIISAFERDDLVSRFGEYVGEVPGDGFDSVNRFKIAIDEYMNNDELYVLKATQAIEYTRSNHSIKKFKETMKHVIHSVAKD